MSLCAICLHACGLDPLLDGLGGWLRWVCGRCGAVDCCYGVAAPPAPVQLVRGGLQ